MDQGGRLAWKVGLLNHQGRYLTAETFGCKINASGTALRKKQIWYIEHDATLDDTVYIRRFVFHCCWTMPSTYTGLCPIFVRRYRLHTHV